MEDFVLQAVEDRYQRTVSFLNYCANIANKVIFLFA